MIHRYVVLDISICNIPKKIKCYLQNVKQGTRATFYMDLSRNPIPLLSQLAGTAYVFLVSVFTNRYSRLATHDQHALFYINNILRLFGISNTMHKIMFCVEASALFMGPNFHWQSLLANELFKQRGHINPWCSSWSAQSAHGMGLLGNRQSFLNNISPFITTLKYCL